MPITASLMTHEATLVKKLGLILVTTCCSRVLIVPHAAMAATPAAKAMVAATSGATATANSEAASTSIFPAAVSSPTASCRSSR